MLRSQRHPDKSGLTARRRKGARPAHAPRRQHFAGAAHDHARCITDALVAAEAICRAQGVRLTRLRQNVLELVWRDHAPVGAYALLDRLREEGRRVTPPTVYRALEFLIACGLVHRIESRNAFVGCGRPARPHGAQFLICRACTAIAELDDPAIAALIRKRAARLGFRAVRQTIEVEGLCPACQDQAGER